MKAQIIGTQDLFNALQALTGTGSAYAVAHMMGVSRVTGSAWRDGKTCMDEACAIKAAELLGLDADYVLACLAAERSARADRSEAAAVWRHVALRLATAAGVFFLVFSSVLQLVGPV